MEEDQPDTTSRAAAGPSAPPATSAVTQVVNASSSVATGVQSPAGSSGAASPMHSTLSSQAHSPSHAGAQAPHLAPPLPPTIDLSHAAATAAAAKGLPAPPAAAYQSATSTGAATRSRRSRSIKKGPGTSAHAHDGSGGLHPGGSSVTSSSAASGSGADSGISVSGAAVGSTSRSMLSSATSASASAAGAPHGGGSGRRKDKHQAAVDSIRRFLRGRSSYDVLPVSFRLIVLDTKLVVKAALDVMWQAGVVSAPLWQSTPIGDTADLPNGEEGSAPGTTQERPAASRPVSPGTVASKPAPPKSGFAGMLTVNDIIHLIQYYYMNSSYGDAAKDVETFRLEKIKDIERSLHVPQPPTLSVNPLRSLYEACQLIMRTHAARLPLIDHDEQTGIETVLSVLTQYRVLKFIAMNCRETAVLHRSVRALGLGTYVGQQPPAGLVERAAAIGVPLPTAPTAVAPAFQAAVAAESGPNANHSPRSEASEEPGLKTPVAEKTLFQLTTPDGSGKPGEGNAGAAGPSRPHAPGSILASVLNPATNPYAPIATATLDTTVFDVVHIFSELGISGVPILDEEGNVVDFYESVDVVTLVRTGAYQALDLTIRQALARRPPDFQGVMACSPDDSLANIFALLRRRRVHRLLILEPEPVEIEQKVNGQDAPEGVQGADNAQAADGAGSTAAPAGASLGAPPMTPRELEAELEAGVVRRRRKGRLVGVLCLSDILKYVIGDAAEQQHQQGLLAKGTAAAGTGSGRAAGTGQKRDRHGSEGSTGTGVSVGSSSFAGGASATSYDVPHTFYGSSAGGGAGGSSGFFGGADAMPDAVAGGPRRASLADTPIPEGRVLEAPGAHPQESSSTDSSMDAGHAPDSDPTLRVSVPTTAGASAPDGDDEDAPGFIPPLGDDVTPRVEHPDMMRDPSQ